VDGAILHARRHEFALGTAVSAVSAKRMLPPASRRDRRVAARYSGDLAQGALGRRID
jgi:hypothetical protein